MITCTKYSETDIDENNIWNGDALDREQVAQKFTNLIDSITQPFVISINSPYGTGKSFFLTRWHASLLKEGKYAALFFNAWQTDFCEHAFTSFMYSLVEQIRSLKLIDENSDLFKNFMGVTKQIIYSIVKNTIETASGQIFQADDIDNAIKSVKRLEDADFFKSYKERKEYLNEFKLLLNEIILELEKNNQKFVIFIDELERCRPTYAVELLESIKHLFDVPGVTFVLGVDRRQLQHTIGCLYGENMDSDGYLKRFIDLELTLPTPTVRNYVRTLFTFHNIDQVIPLKDDYIFGGETLIEYMDFCSEIFGLTLREISQCFTEINVVVRTLGKNVPIFPVLLALLVCLKCKKPDFYNDLMEQNDLVNVLSEFDSFFDFSNIDDDKLTFLRCFFIIGIDSADENFASELLEDLNGMPEYQPPPIVTRAEVKSEKEARIKLNSIEFISTFRREMRSHRMELVQRKSLISQLTKHLSFC